ncbi:hypothetical protein ACHAXT_000307 [Thalassiosira profunda]
MSDSGATILTQETVVDYVAAHAADIGVFAPDATLTAEAIQGGNVNFAFCVKSSDGKSVFVKQAPEYVAVFGPDGLPLTSDRIQKEVAILKLWSSILGDEADEFLPKLYHFDDANKVFVMEFLEGFVLLDHHLVNSPAQSCDMSMAAQLGEFMAKTHLATHSSKVSAERAAELTKDYENRALRDIQLEFVFTKAYQEVSQQTSSKFTVDDEFLGEVNALKSRYNGESGEGNLALCHGDLHPGSVMVKVAGDKSEVRVIDPEFTVYGPPGLDVGSLLSGYVLAAVHQCFAHGDDTAKKEEAVSAIRFGVIAAWGKYRSVMAHGGIDGDVLREIEIETVGYTVAEVCRTALGHAGQRLWLQFDDAEVKEAAVQSALSIVKKCMTARHEKGMNVLFGCLNIQQLRCHADTAVVTNNMKIGN